MLEGLLHHKKEEKDYLCALVVAEKRIAAAIWETTKDGKVTVLKTTQKEYEGEWEKAIDAADQAVTGLESELPEGKELTKVVFGLYPAWLTDDRIKEPHLKQLKALTSALSLTPLGFVELPIAVAHLLQKDEGNQQTVILVGIDETHVTVSLFKIGKLVGSVTGARTESVSLDLEKLLATFTDVEVLPSRVLLYGEVTDLEKLKAELLNHPWQKKANFLHFPKIEVLPADFAVKAVAVASSTEIMPQTQEVAVSQQVTDQEPAVAEVSGKSEEVAAIAEDLGFVTDREDESAGETVVASESEEGVKSEEVANVEPVAVPQSRIVEGSRPAGIRLPRIALPKLTFTFPVPRLLVVPKLGLVAVALVTLLVLGGSVFAVYWWLPKATVQLLVKAQMLDKTEDITVDPSVTTADAEQKILPGKEVKAEMSGSFTVPTTGKKTVGEKAKGEVTIYNKTLNSKTFKSGAILTAGKLKFTLDEEVSVASASESVGSLTYGTVKISVTASDIGTASNVGPGTDFVFTDLPTSSYSARNEKALAGGTSREIAVVARDDQKTARDQAVTELEQKATAEINQTLSGNTKLLANSLSSKVVGESFNKEIGEETDELSVEMTVAATAFAYNESDFFTLLEKIVSVNIPQRYEYKKENAEMSVEEVAGGEGEARVFKARIKVELLPKVETVDLAQKLAGRSVAEATDYLRSQSGVAGVEFDVEAPLASLKKKLPANSGNIRIQVASL